MKELIKGIFSESDGGAVSSTRLMAVASLFAAVFLICIDAWSLWDAEIDKYYIITLLGGAYGSKTIQKFAEKG